MIQPYRLASGGRIDRSRVLPFQFGDSEYEGHPGDTLASDVYDHRGWDKHQSVRENIFWIAADAAATWA